MKNMQNYNKISNFKTSIINYILNTCTTDEKSILKYAQELAFEMEINLNKSEIKYIVHDCYELISFPITNQEDDECLCTDPDKKRNYRDIDVMF